MGLSRRVGGREAAEPEDARPVVWLPKYASLNGDRWGLPPRKGWNRLAIAAAVLGGLAPFALGIIATGPAIGLGFFALGRIAKRRQKGRAFAVFGILAGLAWIPLSVVLLVNARGR